MTGAQAVGKHAVRKLAVAQARPAGQVPASGPEHFTEQLPEVQLPPGHVAPQRPQLVRSVLRLTHSALQQAP